MTNMQRSPARGGTVLALAGTLLLLIGCGGAEAPADASTSTGGDGVAADLLSSVEDLGMGPSVPVAPGRAAPGRPSTGSREGQSLDIETLGYNSGPSEAPVRVLEFSDFGCGYCRTFHQESFPALEEEYMATGKVEWKYVPMILGIFPNAMEAARAGECAGEQGAFPAMRDLLFDKQPEWKRSNDPEPLMEEYAEEVGLEMERFSQCVAQGWQDDRIMAGTQLSQQVGVRGTPTFFVVGYAPIPGAIPLELFREALDTVYAQATRENGGESGSR